MKNLDVVLPSKFLGQFYTTDGSAMNGTASYVPRAIKGYLDSQNNPGWRKRHDSGGIFTSSKITTKHYPSVSANCRNGVGVQYYRGGFVVRNANAGTALEVGNLSAFGALAFNRMKPTRPSSNLFNPVYELKDVVPSILDLQKRWKGLRREIGGLYLSQVFGWIPLINDATTIYETFNCLEKLRHLDKKIQFLIKNEGRWVSTECTLRDTSTYTDTDWMDQGAGSSMNPILVRQSYAGPRERREEVYYSDRIWAKAQFRWFLDASVPRLGLKQSLLRRLQGNQLKVADIYRAIPWTWLVDWAVGGARILENSSSGVADKLACRRFFIMRHQQRFVTTSARQVMSWKVFQPGVPVNAVTRIEYECKQRVRGYPFYPGNPNALSGSQLAILGALGLSKL